MASRLPLGKQQYKAILTGIANPLKGLIQSWDEPLSIQNGEGYVCYQSESIKIDKLKKNAILSEEEETDLIEEEATFINLEEEEEEKSTPLINNKFVRIHYQFHPDARLSFPERYKFAINPNEYFQWSKQKCQDMNLTFADDTINLDFLNENNISILNQSTNTFSHSEFKKHKNRFDEFNKSFWLGEKRNVCIIQEEVELSDDDVENMTKKHCLLYYGKNGKFKTVVNEPVYFSRQKFQLRLDKNLFPKFTKSDKITAELRLIEKDIPTNTPESFILKFVINSKQYTADVFLSGVCCL